MGRVARLLGVGKWTDGHGIVGASAGIGAQAVSLRTGDGSGDDGGDGAPRHPEVVCDDDRRVSATRLRSAVSRTGSRTRSISELVQRSGSGVGVARWRARAAADVATCRLYVAVARRGLLWTRTR